MQAEMTSDQRDQNAKTETLADADPDVGDRDCPGSVSYTHLDVYKRQAQGFATDIRELCDQ